MRKHKYIKSYSDNFFLLSYSDLFRVSIDPRVKPEGDGRGMMPEGDGRGLVPEGVGKKCAPEGNFSLLSSLRAVTRGQAIFELISNSPLSKEGKNKIGMTALFCLLSSTVHAECVPTPDCAEIGYTETSCEGGFVRCPFDISKLYCIPCDSSYQYTCSDSGQVGSGDSCNGKYIECECADGYELVDGACVISCAYTLTALPTGCSAADSCIKNGTTYYSSTCTSCKSGYTISSGTCKANTCSGYYTSKTGCSSYTTCKSGTTTKYKCTACSSGYTLCSSKGKCIDTYCHTELTGLGYGCSEISQDACGKNTCTGSNGKTYSAGFNSAPCGNTEGIW